MAYFQIFGSLTLFAQRYTDLDIFGWKMPAGDMQTVDPLFIIAMAPVFAALWVWLGKRDRDLSSPAKFAWGLLLLAAGMLVMYIGALRVLHGSLVSPLWLAATYFLFACGELCLSPVGLSSTTKLAPARFAGQTMGLWFLTHGVGKLPGGPTLRQLRRSRSRDASRAVPEALLVECRRRSSDAAGHAAGEAPDGGRSLTGRDGSRP